MALQGRQLGTGVKPVWRHPGWCQCCARMRRAGTSGARAHMRERAREMHDETGGRGLLCGWPAGAGGTASGGQGDRAAKIPGAQDCGLRSQWQPGKAHGARDTEVACAAR